MVQPTSNPLKNIKPEYPHLVRYSALDEPLQHMPESQPPFHADEHLLERRRPVDMEAVTARGEELRRAGE